MFECMAFKNDMYKRLVRTGSVQLTNPTGRFGLRVHQGATWPTLAGDRCYEPVGCTAQIVVEWEADESQ